MEYRNPKIPEGINVSNEHPVKDFCFMLAGIGGVIIIAIVVLSLLAEQLVRFIPFHLEQQLASHFQEFAPDNNNSSSQQPIEHYLQSLGNNLATAQQLPKDMSITIHYVDSEQVNALATLGGHIFIFRGLLEKMPNENALAMVIGHEIAHIKHRHPIVSAGRGITVGIALMSIAGFGDSAISQQLIGQVSHLTALNFSRGQEHIADQESLAALYKHYGHTLEAEHLFEILAAESEHIEPPAFFNTHPLNSDRIEAIKNFKPGQSHNTKITPLPAAIDQALKNRNTSSGND